MFKINRFSSTRPVRNKNAEGKARFSRHLRGEDVNTYTVQGNHAVTQQVHRDEKREAMC